MMRMESNGIQYNARSLKIDAGSGYITTGTTLKEVKITVRTGEVTIIPDCYSFRPNGTKDDWIKIATKYKEDNGLDEVKVYSETHDKETGQVSTNFICKL